jgi:hypothetical protein
VFVSLAVRRISAINIITATKVTISGVIVWLD